MTPMTGMREFHGICKANSWKQKTLMLIQHVCLCHDVHFHCNTHVVLIYMILLPFLMLALFVINLPNQGFIVFWALSSPNRGRSNASLPPWPPLIRMMSRSEGESRPA